MPHVFQHIKCQKSIILILRYCLLLPPYYLSIYPYIFSAFIYFTSIVSIGTMLRRLVKALSMLSFDERFKITLWFLTIHQVYDGASPTDPLLGTYCGSTVPPQIMASSNVMLVLLTTTGQSSLGLQDMRFNATFNQIDRKCGKKTTLQIHHTFHYNCILITTWLHPITPWLYYY